MNLKGQVLGERFRLLDLINYGSYSEIYQALNLSPKDGEPETVVVKVLNVSLHGEPDPALERTLIENVQFEALTLKNFKHEHIIRLFECGAGVVEHSGRHFYYLVLEHLAGGDLFHFCRARPLDFETMLEYLRQICDALKYAHAHNTLHRDIKPNNILLTANRRQAKLLDFGAAKLLDGDNGLITKIGTDVYSAPEHFTQAHLGYGKLTCAADIYSLAKTVYFLLSGESPVHQAQRQLTMLPPRISSMPWAAHVLSVLHHATCERPSNRYQTIEEFYSDLSNPEELTSISPRQKIDEPTHVGISFQKKPASSRIEVPIIPAPQRTYKEIAKNVIRVFSEYVKKVVLLLAAGYRVAMTHFRLCGQYIKVTSARSGRRLWHDVKAMPRRPVVRILIVITITISVLLISSSLLKWWRTVQEAATQTNNNLFSNREAMTSTDVNIRSGPSAKERRIGLAERSSHVRVLSLNSDHTWCEIEILQHGRAKEDPDSADRGWVNKKYLTFQ